MFWPDWVIILRWYSAVSLLLHCPFIDSHLHRVAASFWYVLYLCLYISRYFLSLRDQCFVLTSVGVVFENFGYLSHIFTTILKDGPFYFFGFLMCVVFPWLHWCVCESMKGQCSSKLTAEYGPVGSKHVVLTTWILSGVLVVFMVLKITVGF
jgi:hypothetical protein